MNVLLECLKVRERVRETWARDCSVGALRPDQHIREVQLHVHAHLSHDDGGKEWGRKQRAATGDGLEYLRYDGSALDTRRWAALLAQRQEATV